VSKPPNPHPHSKPKYIPLEARLIGNGLGVMKRVSAREASGACGKQLKLT